MHTRRKKINRFNQGAQASRRLLIIAGAGLFALLIFVGVAYSAANTVASSRSGSAVIAANPNQFKPPQCAAINVTGIVNASIDSSSGGSDLILGSPGNDSLSGKNGPDCIVGGAGDDTIKGQGGDDVILGGPGNDDIDGGPGNDICYGEAGGDTFNACEQSFQ